MNNHLTLGGLFSGAGGFELAGKLAGIEPKWVAEVEPFCVAVLRKNFPGVKYYGDVSALNGGDLGAVDIITFGSPCQDVSIAGKRAGLDGSRSSLFYEAIRIITEMREKSNGQYPRYACWENVPGSLSSNNHEDYRHVLEAFIRIAEPEAPPLPPPDKAGWPNADVLLGDGWSVAYRTLSAEYFGVAQRRRRVFLVADFRGDSAGEVLFKSESVLGYTPPSFSSWQTSAGSPAQGIGAPGSGGNVTLCLEDQGGNRMDVCEDITGTLRAETHGHPPCVVAAGFCTEHSADSRGIGYAEEQSPTLRAGVVPGAVVLDNHPTDGRLKIDESGAVPTLTKYMGTGGNNGPLIMAPDEPLPVTMKIRCGGGSGGKGQLCQLDKSATIACNNDQTLFVPSVYAMTTGSFTQVDEEKSPPLMARDYKDPTTVAPVDEIEPNYTVRRLTPTECAVLQGFPQDWADHLGNPEPSDEEVSFWMDVWETYRTAISHASKPKTENQVRKWLADPYTDGAAYRMWGNSLCVNVAYFIMRGIVWAANETE